MNRKAAEQIAQAIRAECHARHPLGWTSATLPLPPNVREDDLGVIWGCLPLGWTLELAGRTLTVSRPADADTRPEYRA